MFFNYHLTRSCLFVCISCLGGTCSQLKSELLPLKIRIFSMKWTGYYLPLSRNERKSDLCCADTPTHPSNERATTAGWATANSLPLSYSIERGTGIFPCMHQSERQGTTPVRSLLLGSPNQRRPLAPGKWTNGPLRHYDRKLRLLHALPPEEGGIFDQRGWYHTPNEYGMQFL